MKGEKKRTNKPHTAIPPKFIHDKDSVNPFPHSQQHLKRAIGFHNRKQQQVNSDPIFQHNDFRKYTKGYDALTGEIDKRGRPADNQGEIFIKKPEKELTQQEKKKVKDKSDAKKRQALNKKLYKERIKNRWDRGW